MLINDLNSIINSNTNTNPLYMRNLLKEALQTYTLNFIYTSKWGQNFLFKGGTCLRYCFELPRLSEDLDFDLKNYNNLDQTSFLTDLENYFKKTQQISKFSYRIAGNDRQIFLQFPILGEPKLLFLRLDLAPIDSKIYTEELSLKTSLNFSFLMKRYSLPDLFASKITAILSRTYFKGKNNEITFKGRDYFDLVWFLQKGVYPNTKRLSDLLKQDLSFIWNQVDKNVENLNINYLKEDLSPLFSDQVFVNNFCQNFKQMYTQEKKKLEAAGAQGGFLISQPNSPIV